MNSRMAAALLAGIALSPLRAAPYDAEQGIALKERVGRLWEDELVHYELEFAPGALPRGPVHLVDESGRKTPCQLTGVVAHPDGSVKSASVWLVATLEPGAEKRWKLQPGEGAAWSDLRVARHDNVLEITTDRTGARFALGDATFDPPAEAGQTPAFLTAIRLRSGTWGGRGWFETPHKCRSYRVWIVEEGPVFVKVGFEYRFDGYRGEGADVYRGHVRIAARQELIEFVEDYSLGDPAVYRIWQPASRAEAIMWDWWAWRPHEAESSFCFSLYDGLRPTRARWYGHNSTIPEKRTGRNPGMDFETDYTLDYPADRFDISVNAYHRGCPDQALSYMAWRDDDPRSDAVGVIGIRPTEWLNADMLPRAMQSLKHHTDTADLRIYALQTPDLVIKAPLHLGRRVWGLVTLRMPEAGPTRHDPAPASVEALKEKNPDQYRQQLESPHTWRASQALRLRSKYGNRQLDKVKDWTLAWESRKTYPSLFVKQGGLEAVLRRVRGSRSLSGAARKTRHLAIRRYLLEGGADNAQKSVEDLMDWCRRHIDLFFEHGYCSHRGTNNNQYPWWMQEMAARFDLIMGMPEVSPEQKETLKAYFAFCTHMLQDDDFMPPRETGVGWGSANMPINTRGGRAVTAAAISDNPDAQAWLERALEYIDALVLKVWAEDGSPVSGPHYVSTQADPLLNMALPLYYAGALPPLQEKYPRLLRFCELLVDRLTPPDRRADYLRILPTIGHTRLEADANIGKFAVLVNLTDPDLAGRMYWLWQRGGASTSGFMDGVYYMHEDFRETRPLLSSRAYPGGLTFLRNGFPREDETFMAIHAGNHGYDHFDRDVGAFLLYAKGAPLMMDFASMYVPNCWQSVWHNTLSWNVDEHPPRTPCPGRGHADCWFTGKTWNDHEFQPHRLLDRTADSRSGAEDAFKEYAGEITAQAMCAEADYVTAAIPLVEFDKSVFYNKAESENPVPWGAYQVLPRHRLDVPREWQRRYVFVKDADIHGPNYFVVHDDLGGQDELRPVANYWCLANEMDVSGDTVRWTGQYEVDLDMYVAFPKDPRIARREWWHQSSQPLPVTWGHGKGEFQIGAHVHQQPGAGGFSVALYPRRRYELAPVFASNEDGTAIRVQVGERRDVVFCARERGQRSLAGATCDGTVAVVKQHPRYTALTLCEPGSVTCGGIALAADAPVSLRVTETEASGRLLGRGTVTFTLPSAFADSRIVVEGKPAGTVGAGGAATLTVDAPADWSARPAASAD